MVTFNAADHARVAAGEITVTWRLWQYAHVKAGRDYSTGFGFVHVEDVRAVRCADVSDADAREAGFTDAASLIARACDHTGATPTPETVLYRVQLRYLKEAPARPQLPIEEVRKRLERLDAASPSGPWAVQALRLIEAEPGIAARILARQTPFETAAFKLRVRKLKALGLTVSLETGYELSELGQALLDSLDAG